MCTFLYIVSCVIWSGKHSEQMWFHVAPPTMSLKKALRVLVNIPDVVCWTNLALKKWIVASHHVDRAFLEGNGEA